ncbi:MAG: cytochrome B [Rhizobiaceae bacterium]|nr:MAG: cytochrome B [Rhizobiaceae bacterium]
MKSTADRYGTVAVAIHWLSAALVLVLLASGFRAAGTIDPTAKASLLRVHAVVGATVLVLTLARIAWWVFADRRPAEAAGMPRLQARAARAVHLLFYVVLIGMAASGVGMLALSGAANILFGNAPGPLPDFMAYAPRIPHGLGALLLVALVLAHVAAALYHQFVMRDRLLARMGIG